MKIAIVGARAMGCLFGALLAEGGNVVSMICNRNAQAQLISERGIIVASDDCGRRAVRVAACTAAEVNGRFDVVLVLTKSSQTVRALAGVRRILEGDATLVSLQNGLGNERPLLEHASADRVLVGSTFLNANRISDNEIASHGAGVTAVSCVSPAGQGRAAAFGAALAESGFEVVLGDDAEAEIWRKACFNSAMSPITALLHVSNGGVVEAGAKDAVLAVARESVHIASELGADVRLDDVVAMLERCWAEHAGHVGSMCADYLNGRPTDIDFLNGEMARRAAAAGLEAPLNLLLARLVKAQSRAGEAGCRLAERD